MTFALHYDIYEKKTKQKRELEIFELKGAELFVRVCVVRSKKKQAIYPLYYK